jgi:PBSX family phage terminase large subunit
MFDPNGLFYKIAEIYSDHFDGKNRITICNEGGTRSAKTWDILHFIITYCHNNPNKNLENYILRDTLIHCKDFTLSEFIKVMKLIEFWNSDNYREYPKPQYNLNGNDIFFRGLDDEKNTEGYPSDILYINETLETQKSKVDGLIMRCRKLVLMDWNPKVTVHWCYKLEGQPNTFFLRSTYKNNKHLQESIIKGIEATEPTEENIRRGTADPYRWKVYGKGERAAYEGLVYPEYNLDKVFPNYAYRYGLDWGFGGDPLACVKLMEYGNDTYLQSVIYQTGLVTNELIQQLKNNNITKSDLIIADNEDPKSIRELQIAGYNIRGIDSKAVLWGINYCRGRKLHILESDVNLINEINNYKWKDVKQGEKQAPVKGNDHLLDAWRYAQTVNAVTPKQQTTKVHG